MDGHRSKKADVIQYALTEAQLAQPKKQLSWLVIVIMTFLVLNKMA